MSTALCFYHCDLCSVDICGLLQWQQHLTGSKHYKKLVQSGKVAVYDGQLVVNAVPTPSATVSPLKKPRQSVDLADGRYTCSVCQVITTGPEPYAQHIASAKHLKKSAVIGTISSTNIPATISTDSVTPPSDDDKDAEYREKYLKDVIVVGPDQKIEDVFQKHFHIISEEKP